MKRYSLIIIIMFTLSSFFACTELEDNRPDGGTWNSSALEGYEVKPINGGAEIRYNIPKDPNTLYVMAEYERNGKVYTEKASVHTNQLTIEGFHRVNMVKVTLYKINRQEQRSEPVVIEFEPLESLIDIATNTLDLIPGFGGVIGSWNNPKMTEFGVRLMTLDDGNELETEEMYFTSSENERRSFRGFEPKETTFAISFEDKWGNISDT